MNGNNDHGNPNNRRPVGAPDTRRRPPHPPAAKAPQGSPRPKVTRPNTPRNQQPLRPQQRRGAPQGRPVPGSGPRPAPKQNPPQTQKDKQTNRNIILATVLLILIIITIIIFGVQSCVKKDSDDYKNNGDDVILNTTEPEYQGGNKVPVYAEYTDNSGSLGIDSGYGILIDLDTNRVIASKGGDERIYPASMTKVMTLIVAYESISDLDSTTYTFDAEMLDELFRANASVAGFLANETVTARDLLYGAILPSGGDATNALAELVAGSEDQFADLMNKKVKELGLKNTHFVTASGLHDNDHYSTCHDIAKILEYAISKPEMRKILSAYQYTTSKTEQHPEGILLTSTLFSRMAGTEVDDNFYVQGGKTGYTNEALHCLCTFASNCREDESSYTAPQYILVTAYGQGNEYIPVFDAIKVYKKHCVN